jgi:hypothetical protein
MLDTSFIDVHDTELALVPMTAVALQEISVWMVKHISEIFHFVFLVVC